MTALEKKVRKIRSDQGTIQILPSLLMENSINNRGSYQTNGSYLPFVRHKHRRRDDQTHDVDHRHHSRLQEVGSPISFRIYWTSQSADQPRAMIERTLCTVNVQWCDKPCTRSALDKADLHDTSACMIPSIALTRRGLRSEDLTWLYLTLVIVCVRALHWSFASISVCCGRCFIFIFSESRVCFLSLLLSLSLSLIYSYSYSCSYSLNYALQAGLVGRPCSDFHSLQIKKLQNRVVILG